MVESEFEPFSDKNRSVLESDEYEATEECTELWDMEVEVGYERFGVAEMNEIFEEDVGTDISAEDEGRSEWCLEECQELLGEVTAEKTRAHASVEECGEPLEDVGQESITKLPPGTNDELARSEGEKKISDEPPREESKGGEIRTDT